MEHHNGMPFAVSAKWYDALYTWKDYTGETGRIVELVRRECPRAKTLLDVACGTGVHALHLSGHFDVEGLDLQPELLEAARKRAPRLPFHEGDMRAFHLQDGEGRTRRFDVVTCLFSSIGYLETVADLEAAFASMAKHLAPDGVLLVEPWFQPADFNPVRPHMLTADQPDLKICRMSEARVEGDLSVIDFFYQVAEGNRVYRLEESHKLRLSTPEELIAAMATAGLQGRYLEDGLMPQRGLLVARHG